MRRSSREISVALASVFAVACQVGAGVAPGAQEPAAPMPPAAGPSAGSPTEGSGSGAVVGGPNCPNPANHCLGDDILFAGKKEFQHGYVYVEPATMTSEPGPSGEATFMSVRDGGNLVTRHYWRTHAAQPSELAIGMLAVMMHRTSKGVYVAPTTREEANRHQWWMARIISTSTLDQGQVIVSGGYLVNADAIRVVEGDESPRLSANEAEDIHFVQPGHWLISKKPLPDKGFTYASVGLSVQAPSDQTGGEGHFLDTSEGSFMWTRHAWKTRPATEADLQPGVHVFMVHRTKGGIYVAPDSRSGALKQRWWTAKVVDTSELYKGVVQVAGGYRVAVGGLRVPL